MGKLLANYSGIEITYTRTKNGRIYTYAKGYRGLLSNSAGNTRLTKIRANVIAKIESKRFKAREMKPTFKERVQKTLIYRSGMFIGKFTRDKKRSGATLEFEVRVWVHTERPTITRSMIESKVRDMMKLFPGFPEPDIQGNVSINNKIREITKKMMKEGKTGQEVNEEVEGSDVIPADARIGEWLGVILVNNGVYKYYARGNKLSQSKDFRYIESGELEYNM